MKLKIGLVSLLLWTFAGGILTAGIKAQMNRYDQNGTLLEEGRMFIQGDHLMRIDTEINSSGDPDTTIIFRGDQEKFYVVQHDDREYLSLDRQKIEEIADQMNAAMRQMQEQLKNMPEAQRKMMEKMMGDKMPQSAVQIEVRSAGSEDGYKKYEVWMNEEKYSEVWADDPANLGIPAGSLDVFQEMNSFFDMIMESFSQNPMVGNLTSGNPIAGLGEVEGFPVRVLEVKSQEETKMTNIEEANLSDDLFQPPSDYRERQIQMR